MELPVKEVLGALVTLAVAGAGYLQWKRTKRSGSYIEDREAAYKAIWQALEKIHLYVRKRTYSEHAFDTLMTKANTMLIEHGLHIAEEDKRHANDYMDALRRLGKVLSQTAAEAEKTARQEFERTKDHIAMPPAFLAAFEDYEAARNATMESFRRAIGAGQI